MLIGIIKGLNDNECGAKGVIAMQSVFAYIIDPPAERLYAVEPVGVDIIKPSPTKVVISIPSNHI